MSARSPRPVRRNLLGHPGGRGGFRLGRVVALLSFVFLLASTALAGRRYFYCATMDATSVSSCCHRDHERGPASVDQEDCCELRTMAGLPSAHLRGGEDVRQVPPAPLAATLAAPSTATLVRPVRPLNRVRCGSDPPRSACARARTMVFLI